MLIISLARLKELPDVAIKELSSLLQVMVVECLGPSSTMIRLSNDLHVCQSLETGHGLPQPSLERMGLSFGLTW